MLLTNSERQRFAQYLEQNISSNEALLKQMEKLGSMDVMITRFKGLIMAYKVVLADLVRVETQTISEKSKESI